MSSTCLPRPLLALVTVLLVTSPRLAFADAEVVSLPAGGDARVVRIDTAALEDGKGPLEVQWATETGEAPARGVRVHLATPDGAGGYEPLAGGLQAGSEIALWARANRCCGNRDVKGRVTFSRHGRLLATVPFRLQVHRSLVRCALPWAGALLGGLVAFLLSTAFVNSRFLPSPRVLTERVEAVMWDPQTAAWRRDPAQNRDLLPPVQRALQPRHRFLNWWRSGPHKFCLPGRLYRETLKLNLGAAPWAGLVPVHDVESLLRKDPTALPGEIFLSTRSDGALTCMATVDGQAGISPGLRMEQVSVAPRGQRARLVYPTRRNLLYRFSEQAPDQRTWGWRLRS